MKRKAIFCMVISIVIFFVVSFIDTSGAFAESTASIFVVNQSGEIEKEYKISAKKTFDVMDGITKRFDASSAFQKAFAYVSKNANDENILTVTATKGEYNISSRIMVRSYSVLDLTDITLINNNNEKGNIIISPSAVCGSFNGYESLTDFTLKNGVLNDNFNINRSCIMRLAHCQNITISNVLFLNNYHSHHVEIAAGYNVRFENCTFDGQIPVSTSSSEALQIDILEESTHFCNFPNYDGTMNKKISVENCSFKNVHCGVGTRSIFAGSYQSEINIKNNTFENITDTAMYLSSYIDSEISGNKLTNCGRGIYYSLMKNDEALKNLCYIYDENENIVSKRNSDCNTVIKNNEITVSKNEETPSSVGIYVFGNDVSKEKDKTCPEGDYAVCDLKITENTINTDGSGIELFDAKNCTLKGNDIKYVKTNNEKSYNTGIYIFGSSTDNNICSNTVNGKFSVSLELKNKSNGNLVRDNTFTNSNNYGIIVSDTSTDNLIKRNDVLNTETAILVTNNSNASIKNNKIKSCSEYGVYFENSSAESISSNSISKIGNTAVNILASNVEEIQNNSINSSGKKDINIYSSSALNVYSNILQ